METAERVKRLESLICEVVHVLQAGVAPDALSDALWYDLTKVALEVEGPGKHPVCLRQSSGHTCQRPSGHVVAIDDNETWHSDGRSKWVATYDL